MKKVIIILAILTGYVANAQSFHVFDVDTSNFPRISAKFYALDENNQRIFGITESDIEVFEDGIQREVVSVSCPDPNIIPISSVLTFDISGSMSGGPIEWAKQASVAWVDALPNNNSECALTTFNDYNYYIQDFTKDKNKLKNALSKLNSGGGTNYNAAFIDPLAGALEVTKNAKHQKIVVMVSDGMPNFTPNTNAIIAEAKRQGVIIFSVTLGMPCPPELKEISEQTGGKWFERVTSLDEAKDAYMEILVRSIQGEFCDIEWESDLVCQGLVRELNFRFLQTNTESQISQKYPFSSLARLSFDPYFVRFENPPIGVKIEKKVTVIAKNVDFNISNISLNNNQYTISPSKFTLKNGESKELTVSYTAQDKGYTFCKLDFETDICPETYYLSGGYIGEPLNKKTLEITKPIAGDIFVVGSDTIVTWTGIPEADTVSLEYTIDNGVNWNLITNTASGLKHIWKNIPPPATTNCLLKASQRKVNDNNLEPEKLQFTLSGHTDNVNHISWSPDGNRVATASSDGNGIIWDATTGTQLHTLSRHRRTLRDISWSPDGNRLATASLDNNGIIWDVTTGTELHTLSGHISWVNHISWSPDGSRIATASSDGNGIIWDAATGEKLHTLMGHTSVLNHISWSPDGNRLATASLDYTSMIWDATTGTQLYTLSGHTFYVTHISWSPDGNRLATASRDNNGIIWDVITGTELHTLSGHTGWVNHISWSPDGSRIATASSDGNGIIWDATTGTQLHTLSRHTSEVVHISWSPDGSRLATASLDYTSMIWDATTGTQLYTLSGHTFYVTHISWSPDGNRVATASHDRTAKIWFVGSSESILQEVESEIFSIVMPQYTSQDIDMGEVLVNSSGNKVVRDFIINTGSWKFDVDSIYFRGADKDAFYLVSWLTHFTVDVGSSQFAEFSFTPQRIGTHNAEIVIITQADTLIQRITGVGVSPTLEVYSGILDFGQVEIGDESVIRDTVLLRNISSQPIYISNTTMMLPDVEQFDIISGGGAFKLAAGEERELTLRFKPRYGGRTSGGIGFEYDGVGSPAHVQLFGTGIGGLIIAPTDSAFAGEGVNLALNLGSIKPEGLQSLAKSFSVDLTFQGTILTPIDRSLITKNQNDTVTISIKQDLTNSFELASVPMIAGLGNVEKCQIEVSNFKLYDASGNIVGYDVEYENGQFTLLGICEEGGMRLINPTAKAGISSISPNPTDGKFEIALNLIEKGFSELAIFNSLGEKVYNYAMTSHGTEHLNIDASQYSNGIYFVVLITPSHIFEEKLIIMK